MRVTGSKWLGSVVSEVTDASGNVFNLETGRIDFAGGGHVVLGENDREALTRAVQDILYNEGLRSMPLLSVAATMFTPSAPENIIQLAGRAVQNNQPWQQHLGPSAAELSLDNFMRIDDRTGATCIPGTILGIDWSLVEIVRAGSGNATRYQCRAYDGSTSYNVDTMEDPESAGHLILPSEYRGPRGGGRA